MIATLRGRLEAKDKDRVILEVAGIGYEVLLAPSSVNALPERGATVLLHVTESVGLYGGQTTFYGFRTTDEKALFETFREHVPATGAKKALEYLEKASKSLPDFRRALLERDGRILSGVFGFTKKTADRLIDALKDKIDGVPMEGRPRFTTPASSVPAGALSVALDALSALGYKPSEAHSALSSLSEEAQGKSLSAEEIVRLALKRL